MRTMIFALLMAAGTAHAQTIPQFVTGEYPTAAKFNSVSAAAAAKGTADALAALAAGTAIVNASILGTAGGLEIGTATSTTAYVDFHSSGSPGTDYDARILGTGGTSSAGQGTLALIAGTVVLATCPTSATGLPSGALWCSGTVVNRVP